MDDIRLMDIDEVCKYVGASKASVYRWIKDKDIQFPAPIRIGPNRIRWIHGEIVSWIEQRMSER